MSCTYFRHTLTNLLYACRYVRIHIFKIMYVALHASLRLKGIIRNAHFTCYILAANLKI